MVKMREPPGRGGEPGASGVGGQPPGRRPLVGKKPSGYRPVPAYRPPGHHGLRQMWDQRLQQAEGRKVVIGKEIHIKGEISACDTLVVEGSLECSVECRMLRITESGRFDGDALVDSAEVAGCLLGNLTVRDQLAIRPTGTVSGIIRYGRLAIEAGGEMWGDVAPLENPVAEPLEVAEPAAKAAEPPKPRAKSERSKPAAGGKSRRGATAKARKSKRRAGLSGAPLLSASGGEKVTCVRAPGEVVFGHHPR